MSHVRPDVFTYDDHKLFLFDLFTYLKKKQVGFNVAKLAKESGVSKSYISMVLNGQRKLTDAALKRLLPFLSLTNSEETYIKLLRELNSMDSQIEKAPIIEEMQKLKAYQKTNPHEAIVYRYLTNWHLVAIREMAAIEGFKLDAKWVQERLQDFVPLSDIEKGFEMLLQNGFLEKGPDGRIRPPDKHIECKDEIFKTAMLKYHEQIFSLAVEHVPKLDKERKFLNAHMRAISMESFAQIKSLLEETMSKIVQIADNDKNPEVCFQFSLLGFSLSKTPKKADNNEE